MTYNLQIDPRMELAYKVDDQVEECSLASDISNNSFLMFVINFLLFIVFVLVSCTCGFYCSHAQLSRRYDNLTQRQSAIQRWMRANADSERGQKIKGVINRV